MNRKLRIPASALALAVSGALTAVAVAASSPTVTTGAASSVKDTSAVLNGTVNPNGAATSYRFEWGLTTGYGLGSTAVTLKAGTKAVSVKATAASLEPGTTYHYRLDAFSGSGLVYGRDRTVKTAGNPPPGAITGPPSSWTRTGATLTGQIETAGAATTWYVQFGLTSFYGLQTAPATIPASATPVTESVTLSGLAPGTTFHYRFVAMHGELAPEYGADATFETFPSPAPHARISVTTTPGHDRRAPFTFTTAGRIAGPARYTKAQICTASATVTFYAGRRKLRSSVDPIQPNCTFYSRTAFKHLPGRGRKHRSVKLRVVVRFAGDGWLAPTVAKAETVTLG
jgi:phosphodiesterase/alkaline phosphatase D-like protein